MKQYVIEFRFPEGWSREGIGDNPPRSRRECEEGIDALVLDAEHDMRLYGYYGCMAHPSELDYDNYRVVPA